MNESDDWNGRRIVERIIRNMRLTAKAGGGGPPELDEGKRGGGILKVGRGGW